MASYLSQNGPTSLKTRSISSSIPNICPKEPKSFLDLLELLEIQNPEKGTALYCHGLNNRGTNCRAYLGNSILGQISSITRDLVDNWSHCPSTLKLLETLSGLILCRRFHQWKAPSKYNEWILKLPSSSPSLFKSSDEPCKEVRSARSTSVELETSTSKLNKVAITVDTPVDSTYQICDSKRPGSSSSQPQKLETLPQTSAPTKVRVGTGVSQRTRSNAKTTPHSQAPEPTATTFIPYSKLPSSPRSAAGKLISKIKAPVLTEEKKTGWVYGFTRPNCSMVKIGTSWSPPQRLDKIGKTCKYSPHLVFQFPTNNAMKVERLVHLYLYKERRKETLLNGCCNDGKGCPVQHQEWFDVTIEYAQSVVQIWADWMNDQKPYDMNGSLRDYWRLKTKTPDLSMNEDIWTSWTKPTSLPIDITRKEEKEEATIKAEVEIDTVHLVPIYNPRSTRVFKRSEEDQADADASVKAEPNSFPVKSLTSSYARRVPTINRATCVSVKEGKSELHAKIELLVRRAVVLI